MNAAALPPANGGALDALLWAYLDPLDGADAPGPAPLEQLERRASPELAARLLELCLQHVLLRDHAEESAAQATAAARPGRAHAGPADADLVLQAEQGVPGAFEVLMERYLSMVIGVAYSLLSDKEAAQDVAQDTFMEAAQTLTLLRERAKFGNWLYGIARRKASFVLRRRRMHRNAITYKQQEEKTFPPQDDPGAPIARAERNENIRAALHQLPEIYREVLVLRYMDDRSYDEIASVLGISLAAVDKRLMRGKSMLREALRRWSNE
ncbi:MAG: sigma-70 family RNA polymerase sigma factor [Planctomycetota bacterium]|nr:sigma-70 family RNA polymerase sigma factor [Planctomycetota bacterium]